MPELSTPIEFIKGIGPTKAKALDKALSVKTVLDLIEVFPFRYIDKSNVIKINEIKPDDQWVLIKATVTDVALLGSAYKQRMSAIVRDDSGEIELVWFQGIKWLANIVEIGKEFLIYGRINVFNGKINIPHPELDSNTEKDGYAVLHPIYNSSEGLNRVGFDQKTHRTVMLNILKDISSHQFPENLPEYLIEKHKLLPRFDSIRRIHFPRDIKESIHAKHRLIFEEFFLNQSFLLQSKQYRKTHIHSFVFEKVGHYFNTFFSDHLPFDLTEAQKRVIREIRKDTGSGKQMNRLLQGDVGSGKTIVALLASLLAIDNGFQVCIMAPLEILARQHYDSIASLTGSLGIKVHLLTGNTKKKARTILLKELEDGNAHILIGTHAVTEDIVKFKRLGLVIIDEQHRFGVEQRAAIRDKAIGMPPHVLVMTATPIPRTLFMSVMGDLDVSIIDELPPGRKPINTIHIFDTKRIQMEALLHREIELGRQAFVIYPLIEESEALDLKTLQMGFERLIKVFPEPKYRISIVHGKMKAADKEKEMDRFIRNESQILIATTVIEVGVNIPNASVMVIENAERFGLSQLHQLRGRVGRGADQSYCILMTSFKLTEEGRKRITTMTETNDGFKIAEVDLELRGPGSVEGTKQSGTMSFKLANILTHQDIFKVANEAANKIFEEDPQLSKPENKPIRNHLNSLKNTQNDWSKIG